MNQTPAQPQSTFPLQPAKEQEANTQPAAEVAAPITEDTPEKPKVFGYEQMKQQEQRPMTYQEQLERKDQKPAANPFILPQQNPQQVKQPAPVAPPPAQPAGYQLPVIGYKIAQMFSNPTLLRSKRGKGDPKKTETWLIWLADRILKKNSV